jgi:hypothetical protein
MQFPFPPQPDMPLDSPGPAFQLFVCILFVLAWFEAIVQFLPQQWREKISDLRFGPSWAAKRRGRP